MNLLRNKIYILIFIITSFFLSKVTPQENLFIEYDKIDDYNINTEITENYISTPDSIEHKKFVDTLSSGQNVKYLSNTFKSFSINRYDNTNIKIDGDLNETVWNKASRFANYCEISPGENTKPQVETEVMMYYDDDNLYFGFICYENDISKLRKTLCERDKMFSDDFCGFFLDTYNEGRQAYELFVNPYGIQGDLMWNTPGNEDDTFDMIWYSEAKVYKDKWTIEIAIPFKSIRFPNKKVQDWQIQFLRIRPRENRYQYSLMP
ncbi:MAG: carbohydrate binding family 9 domain-containing protein, partial [Ignavibacteria bacterium]